MRAERIWLREDEASEVERLSTEECWVLLAKARVGRLAVRVDDGVDIFPVNFTVNNQVVYIRSAPGTKLVDIAHASSVAFEVDESRGRSHWSVVIRGDAERMSFDTEIEKSGVLHLATMTSSDKWNYVKITPSSVSGRRFTTSWTGSRIVTFVASVVVGTGLILVATRLVSGSWAASAAAAAISGIVSAVLYPVLFRHKSR